MRIGVLRMCELSQPAIEAHGSYLSVMSDFYDDHEVELIDVAVHESELPASDDECDGWVITGSPASVYDDVDWLPAAEAFVREVIAAGRPILGICFGHQLMAQACGGRVERAAVGWGAGAHDYHVRSEPPGWTAPSERMTILAMHQDQVVAPPTDAEVWLTSDFCPVAGLTYGERAWSIQPHPEFSPRLVDALCRDRSLRMGEDVARTAIESLRRPLHGDHVADAHVRQLTPNRRSTP